MNRTVILEPIKSPPVYAIAATSAEGRFRFYVPAVAGSGWGDDPGAARKFGSPPDAVLFAEARRVDPDLYTVLGILPGAMAVAEARARAEWERRAS